eukprot:PRCOL_00000741-RA
MEGRTPAPALDGRVHASMIASGDKERLKAQLRSRLVECGWRDELKAQCQELVKARGLERFSVDELVKEVIPMAQARVPDAIKAETLAEIRAALAKADGDAQ